MQSGDAAPVKPAPRLEEHPRPERPPYRADDRPARPQRFPDRRDIRPSVPPAARAPRPDRPAPRPDHRPPPPAIVAAPVAPVVPVAPAPVAKPVIRTGPKLPPKEVVRPVIAKEPKEPAKVKARPQTQPFQKRLWINVGEEMGIVPNDVVNTIAGETGLPGDIVGMVDVRGRHLFVDVVADHANAIIAKLNRTQIKGHKIKVKAA